MQHTDKYKLNLIETSDAFSPDALNENTRKVEDVLAAQAAAEAASQAAEKVKSDVQAKVAKLDRQESQRLATVDEEMQKDALYDYVCAMTPPTASEYTVQPGQWGQLDGSFIPYLNSILGRGN